VATVTIPVRLRPSDINGPKWYLFEFTPNPKKHVILQGIVPQPQTLWVSRLRSAMLASRKQVLVVVHGFNEQFAHATRRAAQLAYDLNFQGATVIFSWPTQGDYEGYLADEATAEWAAPHLAEFLRLLAHEAGAKAIHVLAHSMGARVLAHTQELLGEDEDAPNLAQVILAAPDIDAQLFEEYSAASIRHHCKWMTLYASSRDRALKLSGRLHSFRRAGEGRPPLVVLDSMDTVDASELDTDLIGHGYFSENKAVIDDLFMLLNYGFIAPLRNLRTEQGSRRYYVLK
jgi:esterase/lipase superfamily enzyme